jgi:hypothetical protein
MHIEDPQDEGKNSELLTESNITSTEKFTVNVQLGKGRPRRVHFHALSQIFVLQNVDSFVRNFQAVKDLHTGVGEATLRKHPVALHE